MKMFAGVTDYNWYSSLKEQDIDEANFWRPGGQYNFKALRSGDLFLFKLRYPYNCIAGGGFFVRYSIIIGVI